MGDGSDPPLVDRRTALTSFGGALVGGLGYAGYHRMTGHSSSLSFSEGQLVQYCHRNMLEDDRDNYTDFDKEDNSNDSTNEDKLILYTGVDFVEGRMAAPAFYVDGKNLGAVGDVTIQTTRVYESSSKTSTFTVTGENLRYASDPDWITHSDWKLGLGRSLDEDRPGVSHDQYPVFELTNDLKRITVEASGPVSAATTIPTPDTLRSPSPLNIGVIQITSSGKPAIDLYDYKTREIAKACQQQFPTTQVNLYRSADAVAASEKKDSRGIDADMKDAYEELHSRTPVSSGDDGTILRVERQTVTRPKTTIEEFDATIGIVPYNYFRNHGQKGVAGLHDPENDWLGVPNGKHPDEAALVAIHSGPETAPHEIGHHFLGRNYVDEVGAIQSHSDKNPEDPDTWYTTNAHITEDFKFHAVELEDGNFDSTIKTRSIMLPIASKGTVFDGGAYQHFIERGYKPADPKALTWPLNSN